MDDFNKAILFLIPVFLFLIQFGNFIGGGSDSPEYELMAKSRSIYEKDTKIYMPEYAPLFPTISSFFIGRVLFWDTFLLLLYGFITPILLVLITRKWYAAVFYFTLTNYFYKIVSGLFAEGLLIIFILSLFAIKENKYRAILFIVGIFSHSTAGFVLPIVWAIIILEENKEIWLKYLNKQKLFLFCSPIFGQNQIKELYQSLNGVEHPTHSLTLNFIGASFLKMTPIPFLWKAIKNFIDKKNYPILLFLLGVALYSWFYTSRAWDLIAIFMVIGFTLEWENIVQKKLWIILIVVYAIFHFSQWYLISSKIFC